MNCMENKNLSVDKRVKLLDEAIDGVQKTNEALSSCGDGDEMLDILFREGSIPNHKIYNIFSS